MNTSFPPVAIVLGLKTIRMPQAAAMCKKNPMNCCKWLVRYASPTIYNNSYPLLTHIFLQSLISFIPFLPNINILTRGVRCLFRFPNLFNFSIDNSEYTVRKYSVNHLMYAIFIVSQASLPAGRQACL